jgi:hypothetical protein
MKIISMLSVAVAVLSIALLAVGCSPLQEPRRILNIGPSAEDEALSRTVIWSAIKIGYNAGRDGESWDAFSNTTAHVIVDVVRVCQ